MGQIYIIMSLIKLERFTNSKYFTIRGLHTGLKGKIMCQNVIYLDLYVQNLGKSTTSKKLNQKYESGLNIDFQ